MRSLINAKISGFRLWIIPEPLVPRQEDRRLGERDWTSISYGRTNTNSKESSFCLVFEFFVDNISLSKKLIMHLLINERVGCLESLYIHIHPSLKVFNCN